MTNMSPSGEMVYVEHTKDINGFPKVILHEVRGCFAEAQQLFQGDAQTITPEAFESIKAALASNEIEHKAETKKKAVPLKVAGQAWEDPTLADWPKREYNLSSRSGTRVYINLEIPESANFKDQKNVSKHHEPSGIKMKY